MPALRNNLEANPSPPDDGISLIEIADILYAKRVFLICGLALGIVAFAATYFLTREVASPTTDIRIQFYGPGSPSIVGTSIAEQVSFALTDAGIENVVSGLLVTVTPESDSQRMIVDRILQTVVEAIVAQERATFAYLEGQPKNKSNSSNLTHLHSFLQARDLGVRELYSLSNVKALATRRSMILPAIALFGCVALGIGLALLSSFIDSWREHLRLRQQPPVT